MLSDLLHLWRNIRAGAVLAREGALALVDPSVLPPAGRGFLRLARLIERRDLGDGTARLSAALTRLGPSYVKFGQFLATRPDIVGVAVARDLERLQDRMPPFPRADAVRMVEAALGRPLDRLFASFSEPIAAASIAQVHQARLAEAAGGRLVAVKVMRPERARAVRPRTAGDALRGAAVRALRSRRQAPARPRGRRDARPLGRDRDGSAPRGGSALGARREHREDADFRVPEPEWDLTERDVLTTEWIEAIRLNDLPALEAAGHDLVGLARMLIQTFLRHAIRDGFFHADMHPGNLFVDPEGRLVAVDFGIMGRLGLKERRFLAEILLGFIRRDYRRVAQVHFEAGYVPARHSVEDFAQALRAIGEPIHDRRADEISMARLLTLLFEVTAIFDMATRTELVMLQKTMVVVEGVARNLDPKLDMWSTSEPVVRDWIERNLGPVGRIEEAGRGLSTLLGVIGDLPDLALRAERVLGKLERATDRGFSLTPESLEGIGEAEARRSRWIAAALWVIAAVFIVFLLRS